MLTCSTCQQKGFAILNASFKIRLSLKKELTLFDVHAYQNCHDPFFYSFI